MKRFTFLILAVVFLFFCYAVLFSRFFKEYKGDDSDNSDISDISAVIEEESTVKYFKITFLETDDCWVKDEETHAEGEEFYLMPAVKEGKEFSYYTDQNAKIYYADDTHRYTLTEDLTLTPVFK